MRNLFFGDYIDPDASPRLYKEVDVRLDTDFDGIAQLIQCLDGYLTEYNGISRKPMNLVMFLFAIEHLSRIVRVLNMPGGNALLVGVGGSGRQSLTRLSAFIVDFELKQIEISKNYTMTEWREDMKDVLRMAGTGARPLVFLFSDTQIKYDGFVEDINNMLNSGEIPNLFPYDERVGICEAVRPHVKEKFGKTVGDNMNQTQLYAFFLQRAECEQQKASVEADLAEAIPALEEALKALDTIKPSEINEVKAMSNPPAGVKLVCEGVCVMLGIKPARIPDPQDPSKRIMDYWGPSQKMLSDPTFITTLKKFDKDNLDPKTMKIVVSKYIADENFSPEKAEKASKAAAGLSEEQLAEVMQKLNEKLSQLKEVEDGLAELQKQFDSATKQKENLEYQVDLTGKKLVRASTLIEID
ncbi:Dynein heavy chain [Phytophthora palmivora]|uniref:Dynein heavy chain n=1 Tax=Phytophthora palmivora TaxID=4796 RepID=A0A2P4YPS8_9STRA|nr:Dynein heavy chain [Phytophthora palmivora]